MFRRVFAVAVLLCLICAGGAVGTLAWADKQAGDRIAQGVTVQGVDVGGLTVAHARARLQKRIAGPALEPIVVTLDGPSTCSTLARVDSATGPFAVAASTNCRNLSGMRSRSLDACAVAEISANLPA